MPTSYQITPSQLDAFTDFLDADNTWEDFWGRSQNPTISAQEYSAQCEKHLIDQINRCPKEPILAADRGQVFNEIVDMIIHRRSSPSIEAVVESHRADSAYSMDYIDCLFNGFRFIFDARLCKQVANLYPDALSQYLCGATLPTRYGDVWLYGYIDEWVGDKIYDIKTTEKYHFGKFDRKWQRHLYPYCATEQGAQVNEFVFTVVQFNKTTPLTAEIFNESYTYDHQHSKAMLTDICERFIEWIQSRRNLITDMKIFGGKNPDDYLGKPVDTSLLTIP